MAGHTRGRRCIIRSNREKLLFLLIFMIKGVGVLEPLVHKLIKTREHVTERAKAFAALFRDNIVGGTVRRFDERHQSVPGASLMVDCTVCPIMRHKRSFKEAKVFFSGKHWFYALKKRSLCERKEWNRGHHLPLVSRQRSRCHGFEVPC